MGTSRFSNNTNLTNHTQLQVSDDTSTAKIIKEIKYYTGGLPSIPTAEATPDTVLFKDRGSLQGVEVGEDQVDFPEMSIVVDLTAADVTTVDNDPDEFESDWFNIMNLFRDPADGTTALTSTNSGSVTVKNGFDPSESATRSVTIPAEIDTLRLEMLFQDGTRTFGYKWEHAQPLGVEFGGDATATMTLRFKIWCAPSKITELTSN